MTLQDALNRRITQRLPLKPVLSRLSAPVASITFDDFPKSAWTTGGDILEQHGVKGTYYVAGGFDGRTEDGLRYFDAEDLKAVAAAGHEVGCHTFSHERTCSLDSASLMDDVERNAAYVQDVLGDYALSSFAYPYGEASPRTKLKFAKRFPTSRGIRKGVNTGLVDLSQLKAVGVEAWWWTPGYIESMIKKARQENGWLIFFTHDISDQPSPYGATPGMLEHCIAALKAEGVEILPVKHALAKLTFN
jgi:peptidoglycan/xylan/chitin deacetylase (PgdA/CDA1 family)